MRGRDQSDDDLMTSAAGGDAHAFAELVRRHRSWVRWLAYAFVRDHDQAEDLAQEVFCRAYRSAGEYVAGGRFVPWLKRIAVNLAKDALRRRRAAPATSLDESAAVALDERLDPRAALASDVLRGDLRRAIEALPEEQRLVVVMHYFGGMTLEEIAWALQCPAGTVKSRLFYGLKTIRRSLTAIWEREDSTP
jgi:RNA polymerase sigma-70 factor (ECF subfamily)